MPYIKKERRESLDQMDAVGNGSFAQTTGELNYLITNIVADYLKFNGLCYATINDVIGVLECAKLEFYRRLAAPYEDEKKRENGDVF